MDNGRYHSAVHENIHSVHAQKQPLLLRCTDLDATTFKSELLNKVKVHKCENKYVIDGLLLSSGQEVLGLNPFHCKMTGHSSGFHIMPRFKWLMVTLNPK